MSAPRKNNATGPESKNDAPQRVRLKLIGIGGAGGNAISQMAQDIAGSDGHPLAGLELIAINTDLQALNGATATEKVPIGSSVTHGLGAGGDMELGLRAAQQDTERIEAITQNTDLAFLIAGMGGGTGTGAAPVVARVAREQGALVLAFAMLPFGFEGDRRRQQALIGLEQLRAQADAVICIPNDKLFKVAGENATAPEAFKRGNELIANGAQAFWQLLSRRGLINVDFADLRTALGSKHSDGIFSFGTASGSDKAKAAVEALMQNPLMDGGDMLGKADAVLVSILGGPDMTLADVQKAVEPISRAASRAHVIMGAAIDEGHRDRLTVTVIATAQLMARRAVTSTASVRQVVGRRAIEQQPMRQSGQSGQSGSSVGSGQSVPAAAVPAAAPTELKAAGAKSSQPKQESLPLEGVSRGRFDKSEPTIYDGEDLDVPTYLRRGVSMKR